jgi:hypothetical protein
MTPMLLNISQGYDSNMFSYDDDSQLSRSDVVAETYDLYSPKLIRNSWEDKNEDKIDTCNFVEREEEADRWIGLYSKFEDSFNRKKHLFSNVSPYKIKNDFKKSLETVLSFLPKTIIVGVSDDECAYIYFEKDNKSVYFDLFFEPEQMTEGSITVFENKVSKFSFTDYLDNAINKIKNEFITENDLSRQTSAAI